MRALIEQIPDEIEVLEDGDGFSTIVLFAESDDQACVVSVDCHAGPAWHEDRFFYELYFQITVTPVEGDSDDIIYIQSEPAARQYIPAEVRPLILPIVQKCYGLLIEAADYPTIYRVTYCPNPDEIDLRKHQKITESLQNEGYEIEEDGTDDLGREFWLMRPAV